MRGRILAVDYGQKRTGLAVSDALGITATPLASVISESLQETVEQVVATALEKEVRAVLVGMPYLRSGEEGAQCARVRLFLLELRSRLPSDIELFERDERFTTAEADRLLRQTGKKRKDYKKHLDATAAVVLLRDYLMEAGQEPDRP